MPLKSFSFAAYTAGEIADTLRKCTGFQPTLGIIFSSPALGIPECAEAVSAFKFPVFGCSTSGEILPVEGDLPVHDGTAACCFLDIDPGLFSVSLFNRDGQTPADLGRRIGEWGLSLYERPAFIVAIAGLKNDGEKIVRGIESSCPEKTAIFGGIAGDDGNFVKTYVFSHTGYSTDGAVVLAFDGRRVDVQGIATSGWVGVGADMVVTSSEGNVVHTINNRPALELFREYLNLSDDVIQRVGVTFPLLVKRPDGSEVLRAFLTVDPAAGTLTFAGTVPQDARVRFSSFFGYEIIEQSIGHLQEFHSRHPRADLVFLISCMARHEVAGPMVNDEIAAAAGLWNAPLIGFFSYGEIGLNPLGTCDFYNETLSLATIRLKP